MAPKRPKSWDDRFNAKEASSEPSPLEEPAIAPAESREILQVPTPFGPVNDIQKFEYLELKMRLLEMEIRIKELELGLYSAKAKICELELEKLQSKKG